LLRFILLRVSVAYLVFALFLPSHFRAAAETTATHSGAETSDEALPTPGALEPIQAMPGAGGPDAPALANPSTQTLPNAAPAARPNPNVPGDISMESRALPHDLSPWGMFLVADIVVQAVMVGLVIASIVTWTVWLAKSLELTAARSRTRKALSLISGQPSLSDAAVRLSEHRGVVTTFVDEARSELRLSSDSPDKAGIKERVESRLDGLRTAAARQMNAGTGLLATIGSTAPFVGLFGTVWGIMNSFIGISEAQTTNLAVVAPGIAEALLATALGLAAAIPAVIIYNYFSRSIAGYRALITDAAAEVMRQLSRDLDANPGSKRQKVQAAAE
jgi:biopolymer transport protein ExbB